jgi:hypothetical protein
MARSQPYTVACDGGLVTSLKVGIVELMAMLNIKLVMLQQHNQLVVQQPY